MKLSIAVIFISAIAASLHAQDTPASIPAEPALPSVYETRFFLAPSVKYSAGETEYVMDIRQIDPDLGVLKLKSQLEFPLDGFLAGGTAGLHILRAGRPVWRFELGVWTNVNDPSGTMYDHDWTNFYTGVYEKFSYTESDVEMNALLIDARAARGIVAGPNWDLSLLAGYRYQKIEQDVIGFEGWQLVPTVADPDIYERVYFDYDDLLGITYEVTYNLPNAGMLFTVDLGERANFAVAGAYALVMVSDRDDHILRSKVSTADFTGHGVMSDISFEYAFPGARRGTPFVALTGDLNYYSASGSQEQYWYDDELVWDPNLGEYVVVVPQGTRLTGIPHDIHSLQFRAGLNVGIRF